MPEYRVNLDVYNGPMDLLLYLIRREEVDVQDIPVARITEQYIAYVDMLQQIDPDLAGEFLVLAATLLEIKTRLLLPAPPPEEAAASLVIDPRAELVRQLLQYKAFKDAAGDLQDAAEARAARFARSPAAPEVDPTVVDLEDAQVWDLVDAFSKLLDSIGHRPTHHEVIYDDTPLELLQEDLLDRLASEGPLRFSEVFAGCSRSEMVGLFLALLELVRLHKIVATQEAAFGEIHIYAHPGVAGPASEVQVHEPSPAPEVEPPAQAASGDEVAQQPCEAPVAEDADAAVAEPTCDSPEEQDASDSASGLDSSRPQTPVPVEGSPAGRYVADSPTIQKTEHENERGTEDQGTGV